MREAAFEGRRGSMAETRERVGEERRMREETEGVESSKEGRASIVCLRENARDRREDGVIVERTFWNVF